MRMMISIVEEVAKLSPIQDTEVSELTKLLEDIQQLTNQILLTINEERWIAMGVHLLAFMRRVQHKERLAAMDLSLMEEGDVRLQQISQKVLDAYGEQYGFLIEPIEIFLLQVHLETAKTLLEETK
ncbi:PRD domain-containing protein [Brevibacillus laterosporus]|uniref:PRD domain-containing protein n=1 Tax=Brevibacillus laterosporus TaxID=1465 RepID=UPI002404CDCC|nr:PRD domain-containing protein [Brevibacillus laterosporus]MDF9411538.1 PRD domain-containing protein [Brevibacillus laterosporus]